MLSGELEDIGTEPVNSSGSANIYRATYKGCEVAARGLKSYSKQPLEDTHKVRILRYVYLLGLLAGSLAVV